MVVKIALKKHIFCYFSAFLLRQMLPLFSFEKLSKTAFFCPNGCQWLSNGCQTFSIKKAPFPERKRAFLHFY